MNHSTFGQLLIQDLQENLDLLIRGLNSPYSIFGFFPTMGWNIQGLASSNLPLITEKFVAIRQGLTELIKEEELTQAEVNSLGQQLESNFEVFCQEVMAGYFNNVTDEQMESFVKDTAAFRSSRDILSSSILSGERGRTYCNCSKLYSYSK